MIPLLALLVCLPQDAAALLKSGREKSAKKDYRGAEADFSRAIGLDPKLWPVYDARADARCELGNWKGAEEDYGEAIVLEPTRWQLHFGRGVVRITLKELDGAISDLGQAIELAPKEPLPYLNRAKALQRKEDPAGAEADYSKAIELAPKYPAGFEGRGIVREARGNIDGALEDLGRAIELGSKDDYTLLTRGRLLVFQKEDPRKGLEDFNRAIALQPKNPFAFFFRGCAYLELEEWDKAIADLTRGVEQDPTLETCYVARGEARRGKGDRKGALADFDKAIAGAPDDGMHRLYRACTYADLRDWKKALEDFRKGAELGEEPRDRAACRSWICRSQLGEREAATKELKEYLKTRKAPGAEDWAGKIGSFLVGGMSEKEFLDSAKTASQKCEAGFYAGSLHLLAGDRSGAEATFRKGLDPKARHSLEYLSTIAELEFLKARK